MTFLRCWSELFKLLAACPSQARSSTARLAIDDPMTRAAVGMCKAPAGTDLHRLSVCGPGAEASSGNPTAGIAAIVENGIGGPSNKAEMEGELGVATSPEAKVAGPVGGSNIGLREGLGAALVALVALVATVFVLWDRAVAAMDAATDGSKSEVPPAPTVRLDPAGRALLAVTTSVPANTFVPPV